MHLPYCSNGALFSDKEKLDGQNKRESCIIHCMDSSRNNATINVLHLISTGTLWAIGSNVKTIQYIIFITV